MAAARMEAAENPAQSRRIFGSFSL